VAIGRCIVREPAVFLFDEPLSNLDAKLRAHMRTELALLHERLGKTTIYVTHDQVEAMTLASRIVIFDKGRIQQVGTPSDVFNQPANLFVAAFIGMPSMNLLEGQVQVEGGQALLTGPGFAFPLPDALLQGKPLIAGVRPQTLQLAQDAGMLQLQVDVVEYLGMESLLVGKLVGAGDGRVTAVVPGQRADLMRQTVGLSLDAGALHVFDKASGQRIRM
jgi:ABC-type sugar transport system ATPase subunit